MEYINTEMHKSKHFIESNSDNISPNFKDLYSSTSSINSVSNDYSYKNKKYLTSTPVKRNVLNKASSVSPANHAVVCFKEKKDWESIKKCRSDSLGYSKCLSYTKDYLLNRSFSNRSTAELRKKLDSEIIHRDGDNCKTLPHNGLQSHISNKYLQSTINKEECAKSKVKRRFCSIGIKNVKIDKLQQRSLLKKIYNEISVFSARDEYKTNVRISLQLESYLTHLPSFRLNESVYKAYKVLHVDGSPSLAVITNYSVYLIGVGACCCSYKLQFAIDYVKLAAVVISPSSQFLIFINKLNKKSCIVNTAAFYGIAREFVAFLEVAIRRWSSSNYRELFFSAVEADLFNNMSCFYDVISNSILSQDENIIFHSWAWLQEDCADINPLGPQKDGYLMFKAGYRVPWCSSYVRLKAGGLYVFDKASERVPKFVVPLTSEHCKTCRYLSHSDRPYSFEVLLEGNISYLFGAANESDMIEWLQCLVSVTSNEFDCKEASEKGGDWILHFTSESSYLTFCSKLMALKPNLFLETDSAIENECSVSRCNQANFKLQSQWDTLINLVPVKST